MSVQFSPARPAEELNGIDALKDRLMKPAADPIVAVVVFARTKRVEVDGEAEDYPVVRMTHIEPVFSEDLVQVTHILERARVARTGKEQLDMPEQNGEPGESPFDVPAEEGEPAFEPIVDHAPPVDPDAEAAFEAAAVEKPARRSRAKKSEES